MSDLLSAGMIPACNCSAGTRVTASLSIGSTQARSQVIAGQRCDSMGKKLVMDPFELAELKRLWNESGWSQDAIAAHFGLKRRSVVALAERLKFEKRLPYAPSYAKRNYQE